MPAGRPTLYSDEINEKAREYLRFCREKPNIPFIEELALELDVCRDTILEWTRQHEEFSCTIQMLMLLQSFLLKKGSLCKKLQPNVAIFLLKANHGLTDDPEYPDPFVARNRKEEQVNLLEGLLNDIEANAVYPEQQPSHTEPR